MDKHACRAIPTLALALSLTLLACGTAGTAGPRRSASILTAEEIVDVPATTVYEVVQRVRPQWLRARSLPTSAAVQPTPPMVYLDGVRVGRIGELRRMRPQIVARMEFLSPTDATGRFGTNHDGGAILVTTR